MTRRGSKLATGVEHYDDGYSSEEDLNEDLDFSKIFFGREKELKVVNEVYQGIRDQSDTDRGPSSLAPVVLVDGILGSGKSTFVRKFITDRESEQSIDTDGARATTFLEGKFEQNQCLQPFSAIVQALSIFSSSLNKQELNDIRDSLMSAMEPEEIQVLVNFVPKLANIFIGVDMGRGRAVDITTNAGEDAELNRQENAWNQLKYIIQTFFQQICTEKRLVIIFIDDLHWADNVSLDLIASLLTDTSLLHLMFIGTYRGNEVHTSPDHPLPTVLDMITKNNQPVKKIELERLSAEETAQYLSQTFQLDTDDVKDLTDVVYNKTRGNFFFLAHTLEELRRKNDLYYSYINFRWEWHLENVKTALSDDVVDVVLSQLQRIPSKEQQSLAIFAYIRSTIDVGTLQSVMKALGHDLERTEQTEILDKMVLLGFLCNDIGSDVYKFSHDRIQEAAYSLIPSDQDIDSLRLNIGKCLWDLSLKDSGADWMAFGAAKNLNAGDASQGLDPIFLVELNLKVGKKAYDMAAYDTAAGYFQKGADCLKKINSHWENHYDLSLELFQALGEVEVCLGHFDVGSQACEYVKDNARNLDDKIPAFLSRGIALGRQNRNDEALSEFRNILQLMGEYPKNSTKRQVMKDFDKMKKYLKQHSDDSIMSLPALRKDSMEYKAMNILFNATIRADLGGNWIDTAVSSTLALKLTLKHGLCSESAQVILSYAIRMLTTDDFKLCLRLARLSRRVLDRFPSKKSEAYSSFISNYYILPWSNTKCEEIMESYQRGYRAGMGSGETEIGISNRYGMNSFTLDLGHPLGILQRQVDQTVEQCQFYNVASVLYPQMEDQFLVRCLIGQEELNWNEFATYGTEFEGSSAAFMLRRGYEVRLQLGVYFNNYEFAEKVVEKLTSTIGCDHGSLHVQVNWLLFSFLMAYGMACQTGKRKYISMAKQTSKDFADLLKSKPTHTLQFLGLLMEAGIIALTKSSKPHAVQKAFDKAFVAARDLNRTQVAALGAELAGNYFLKRGDRSLSTLYYSKARDNYQIWGAMAKVKDIEEKRGVHTNDRNSCLVSSLKI